MKRYKKYPYHDKPVGKRQEHMENSVKHHIEDTREDPKDSETLQKVSVKLNTSLAKPIKYGKIH